MKLFKSLFLLFSLILGLSGTSVLQASENTDIFYNILKKGEITVGVSLLPPWVMKNKKGTLVGFEIDIARQLAKDMGVKVRFRQYPWQQMIPALKKGEIDIIASGLSITPQRALEISFSQPYHSSGYSLVSNLELTKDFTSIKDLNSDKVYITAMKGTVSAELATKVFPNANIDLRKDEKDAASAVINGSVHALVASSPIPEFISLRHPDKVDLPLKKPLLVTREAFAVRKGNQEMLNYLNSWITAHEADDWIKSSHKYWFKSLKWQRHLEK